MFHIKKISTPFLLGASLIFTLNSINAMEVDDQEESYESNKPRVKGFSNQDMKNLDAFIQAVDSKDVAEIQKTLIPVSEKFNQTETIANEDDLMVRIYKYAASKGSFSAFFQIQKQRSIMLPKTELLCSILRDPRLMQYDDRTPLSLQLVKGIGLEIPQYLNNLIKCINDYPKKYIKIIHEQLVKKVRPNQIQQYGDEKELKLYLLSAIENSRKKEKLKSLLNEWISE